MERTTTPGAGRSSDSTRPTPGNGLLRRWLALWVPLAVYSLLIALAFVVHREQMNSDGICYLRHAQYLAEGRLFDSVSGYWSPLLSWSLAPFIGLGLDGVYAAHLVMALWGAALLGASFFFMRRFTRLTRPWDLIVMTLLAVKTVGWAAELITPDLALASFLFLYHGVAFSPDLMRRTRTVLIAGMLGGIAYLAKSYGLPFFLAHWTLTVGLTYWVQRNASTWRHALRTWALGLLAFMIVAGPWISLLSIKYGKLTFSTVARIAHTVVGPPDKPRGHPTDTLVVAPPGRLTVWEEPTLLPYNHWSPLESPSYFKHQVKVVDRNLGQVIDAFSSFDALRFFPGVLVLVPIILLALRRQDMAVPTVWIWYSVGLYAGGFLPLFFEPRYVVSYLWPVCTLYFFDFLFGRGHRIVPAAADSGPWIRLGVIVLSWGCVLSFAYPALYDLQSELRSPATQTWRRLATRLEELHCRGPIAASPGTKTEGMLTSYLAQEPFYGLAKGDSTAEIEAALEKFGVETFLVREGKWPLAQTFVAETHWVRKETFTFARDTVHIFAKPGQ